MSKNLAYIDLSHNKLTGEIQSYDWKGLQNLTHIDLSHNSLYGNIPSSLLALQLLKKVKLSTINLTEKFLTFQMDHNLYWILLISVATNCKVLYPSLLLSSVEFSFFRFLPTSSTITRLELASCGLKVFPDLKNQARLTYLDLSDNQISGEVPNWIWNVGNGLLQHLNLSFDQLVSLQKPYQIPGLSVLDLHSNKLSGNIPTLPPSASYLDYSRNIFTSSLPPNISSCLSCTIFFSLSSNGLKGFIPNSICDAGYLQVLDLSNSSLTGAIPKCLIERIVSLGVPNLRGNSLSGNIPDAFLSHCSIQTLNVNGYELEGKIPRSLARCKMLEVLDLGNNRISDSFPCHLKNISTLRILVLRANEFHGKIGCPAIMAPRPKHQIVDIAHHSFNGRLPEKWLTTWEAMMGDDDQAQLSVKHLQFESFPSAGELTGVRGRGSSNDGKEQGINEKIFS
ncbi:hypothetical protein SCA6_002117 [Theobroma cacao]